jgi:UDP-glucose 4-epimerase
MRLLLTGGAGYIGGFTTRLLVDAGHDVTVLDTLDSGDARHVGQATLLRGNVTDGQVTEDVLRERGIEAVLHFAALKSVEESWREPDRYRAVNVGGTASLLQAMRAANVRTLVYSGSCAVYGNPQRLPVDETHPVHPLNPYGQSKLLAEQEIQAAGREGWLRWVTLRYFNAAGAALDGSFGEPPDSAVTLIPNVLKVAAGDVDILPVNGTDHDTPDGTAVRDYVHVIDLADAHVLALDYLTAGGEPSVINLGTGRGSSVREIVDAARRVTGRSIPVRNEPRRPGDPSAVWADASRANQLLGWKTRYGTDAILTSAWQWQVRARAVDPFPGTPLCEEASRHP